MKMKASELRIGNWVKTLEDGSTRLRQVTGIETASDNYRIDGFTRPFVRCRHMAAILNNEDIEYISPIELSPEILEKAGFEKDGFGAYNKPIEMFSCTINQLSFSGDYLYLRQGDTDKRHEDSICVLWNKDLMKEFYVHQLQNLYFALTGQELTINL